MHFMGVGLEMQHLGVSSMLVTHYHVHQSRLMLTNLSQKSQSGLTGMRWAKNQSWEF